MANANRAHSVIAALVLSFGAMAGCSSSNNETADAATAGTGAVTTNAMSCPNWSQPLDSYGGPSVTHEGAAHTFRFDLLNSTPKAPPSPGDMNWTIKILDANNKPVKDATISEIKTWMPEHKHGSTARPVPVSNGDGTYTINHLYLYMPGLWQITVGVTSGSTTDSAVFTFCLGT